jgi:hypothetical protein
MLSAVEILIDTQQQLAANADKLENYCLKNLTLRS